MWKVHHSTFDILLPLDFFFNDAHAECTFCTSNTAFLGVASQHQEARRHGAPRPLRRFQRRPSDRWCITELCQPGRWRGDGSAGGGCQGGRRGVGRMVDGLKGWRVEGLVSATNKDDRYCWWFRNPAFTHQLRFGSWNPIIFRVSKTSQVVGNGISTS